MTVQNTQIVDKPLVKSHTLNRSQFYESYLKLLNNILPIVLTEKEIKVLCEFISLPDKYKMDMFSSRARKSVKETLNSNGWNISNFGLNNYITSLHRKGILYRQEDGCSLINREIKKGLEKESLTVIFNYTVTQS